MTEAEKVASAWRRSVEERLAFVRRTAIRLQARGAAMRGELVVYAVEYGDEMPAEVDTLWLDEGEAKVRAAVLNDNGLPGGGLGWHARPWKVL